MYEKTCLTCGKKFFTKKKTQKYCSISCGIHARDRNLIGQKFGKLTVLYKSEEKTNRNGIVWGCICECGTLKEIPQQNLMNGTKSCGCSQKEHIKNLNYKNLTGLKFNKLTVIKLKSKNKNGSYIWECKCDCGNTIYVTTSQLKSGQTKSCGCLRKEKHHKTHGLTKHKLYRIYWGMKGRCYDIKNHRYNLYGGRGIAICDEWLNNFLSFYNWSIQNGYKDGLTIDRIDGNNNYTPSNCRWINKKNQNRNLRTNNNITFKGKTKCIGEWCEITGLSRSTLSYRLKAGWNIKRALTEPKH